MDLKEEDCPVNNIGGGMIQGAGIGPQGEPGVHPKRKKLVMATIKRGYKGFKEFKNASFRPKP